MEIQDYIRKQAQAKYGSGPLEQYSIRDFTAGAEFMTGEFEEAIEWITNRYFKTAEGNIWYQGNDLMCKEPLTTEQLLNEYFKSIEP